ncbi:MAG: alanine--tRNA ligase, partial [Armatimonadetes bacterium]|nr:alanine--tRNA ligase [Armatimonadota bacterium]
RFQVSNTVPEGNSILHLGTVTEGKIEEGAKVVAQVDKQRRDAIRRHHTATHLLQAALRKFVGEHVRQSGSLVAPDHLRFDFTHHEAVGADILEKVEEQVNGWIMADLPVTCTEKPLEEAKAEGIIALFGEKYGDVARVVEVKDDDERVSAELCGGTHCTHTGQIGSLRITSESSVAAGIRRIEAVVGQAALQRARTLEAALTEAAQQLSTTPEELPARLAALQDQISELEKQLQQARRMQATTNITDILEKAVTVGPVRLITARIEGADEETLGTVADQLTAQAKNSIVCLAGTQDDGAILIIKLGKDAVNQGVNAGDLMQILAPLAGGGGGGGPSFARGGGKASQIDEAFEGLHRHLEEQIGHEGLS